MSFSVLKDKLGEWYQPLSFRITSAVYDKMLTAAKRYSETTCYPDPVDIFKVFKTSPEQVKVVILGQDPYHDGNATGLAFECKTHISPSMDSIQDAYQDYYKNHFNTDVIEGKLEQWSDQGVFLLNTALTVEAGKPNSHKSYWEEFTTEVIKILSEKQTPIVFMLWGSQAQSYSKHIAPHHFVLKSEHPVAGKYSGRKWKHNDCFAQCNEILIGSQQTKIQW